jgi:hypothetical protein
MDGIDSPLKRLLAATSLLSRTTATAVPISAGYTNNVHASWLVEACMVTTGQVLNKNGTIEKVCTPTEQLTDATEPRRPLYWRGSWLRSICG